MISAFIGNYVLVLLLIVCLIHFKEPVPHVVARPLPNDILEWRKFRKLCSSYVDVCSMSLFWCTFSFFLLSLLYYFDVSKEVDFWIKFLDIFSYLISRAHQYDIYQFRSCVGQLGFPVVICLHMLLLLCVTHHSSCYFMC